MNDHVPYEFVCFASPLTNMSADHSNLVIDPVANIRSSDEGKEQHGSFKGTIHDSGSIVECSVDIPFSYETFYFGSISIEYFRFSAD
jgi:hypothetical protein